MAGQAGERLAVAVPGLAGVGQAAAVLLAQEGDLAGSLGADP